MKKYKITTAKNAVKKGLVKEGDKIWIEGVVESTDYKKIGYKATTKIRIPIPEPKAIDFGEAGRVLKSEKSNQIVTTTGLATETYFSGYNIRGYCANDWDKNDGWTDITDTYKP